MATIPSLALIPSGYKASKVYSVLPTDGTGDFDFTRSGNATRLNSDGLIELVSTNVPRLNYPLIDGVVQGCPSLLLEPQRTNSVPYSEDFTDASWFKRQITISPNEIISPNGTLNADKISDTSDNNMHGYNETTSTTADTPYNASVFVKKGTIRYVALQQYYNTSNGSIAFFDLENGTLVYSQTLASSTITFSIDNEKIESYGNGWYRISATFTSSASMSLGIALANSRWSSGTSYNNYYIGNGDYLYSWGFQLEVGSYPTSYIKSNSGSATTRSAETCNNAGDASTFNDSEGVLMAEISALANDGTDREMTISDGTNNNRVVIGYNSSNQIVAAVLSGGVQMLHTITTDILLTKKIALKYKQNDFALWFNGFKVYTDLIGSTFSESTLNQISFNRPDTDASVYAKTKQIQYFNTALNDTDLETLTSWDSFSDMATSQLYTIE